MTPAAAAQAADAEALSPEAAPASDPGFPELLDPRLDPGATDRQREGTAEPVRGELAANASSGPTARQGTGPFSPEPVEDPVLAALGIGSLLGSGLAILLALPAPRDRRGGEHAGDGSPESEHRFLEPEDLAADLGREPVDHPGASGALLLGEQALREGKLQAAAAWFEAAHSLDPSLEIAYLLKGVVLEEIGRLEGAMRAVEEAVRLEPGDAACSYLLARLSSRRGQRERARTILAEMRAELPGLPGFVLEDEGFRELHDDPIYLAQIGALDPAGSHQSDGDR